MPPIAGEIIVSISSILIIPFILLGHVTKGRITVDDKHYGNIEEYKGIYNGSLSERLK